MTLVCGFVAGFISGFILSILLVSALDKAETMTHQERADRNCGGT